MSQILSQYYDGDFPRIRGTDHDVWLRATGKFGRLIFRKRDCILMCIVLLGSERPETHKRFNSSALGIRVAQDACRPTLSPAWSAFPPPMKLYIEPSLSIIYTGID